MSGKYSVEDLLKLRASPLIIKPANLPAIEDILAPPDTATKRPTTRSSKPDDATTQPEGFPKRPILDSQQRRSTTDPDRIVLGPPRRSFASSNARALGKSSLDSPEDGAPSQKTNANDNTRNGEVADTRPSDRRANHTNGRYSSRLDQDSADDRPRRTTDNEEDGGRSRRDMERKPKWAGPDEEKPHRSKFEQPWFRRDRGGDSLEDTKPEGNRHSDWRRDRGKDRPWDRAAPAEEDPEWMDEPVQAEQPAPARTQEDFQRWKERMKAGKSGAVTTEEVVHTPSSPEPPSTKSLKAVQTFVDEADDSMDKFFARFNEAKIANEPTIAAKAHTKTRFASLFSPATEIPPQAVPSMPQHSSTPVPEPPSYTPVEAPSANADQAGFARILEMLQGRSQASTSSQSQDSKSRVPLYARDNQPAMEEKQAVPNFLDLITHSKESDLQPLQLQQRVQDSRSPIEQGHGRQQSNKDEMLLNLLRQANQAPKPTPVSSPLDHHMGRGMYSEDDVNRNAIVRNQMAPQTPFDRPPGRTDGGRGLPENYQQQPMRYSEEPNVHEHLRRRPTGELPRGEYDPALLSYLRSQAMTEQQKPNAPSQQGPPPGLGRPPGLDQMSRPPAGWPPQQPQQQPPPPPRQSGPPGMPNIPRNVPSQYPNPHINPHIPPPTQRSGPQPPPPLQQRKYTGESGMPGFPAMGPPPGFMNNAPPPGFPGGSQYGRYQGPPEQGPGRGYMEMYSDLGRGAVRGGAPGGYR